MESATVFVKAFSRESKSLKETSAQLDPTITSVKATKEVPIWLPVPSKWLGIGIIMVAVGVVG